MINMNKQDLRDLNAYRRGKKKAGKGSHGSLTKAGKIRGISPIQWNTYERKTVKGLPKRNKRKKKCPRVANRIRCKRTK